MRIKRGITTHRKHKKLLASTSGYRMSKHRLIKVAKEAALHAGQYAYAGRKQHKTRMRRLWITRISGSLEQFDLSYSQFINNLKQKNISLDRKILAYLAVEDADAFKTIVDRVKSV